MGAFEKLMSNKKTRREMAARRYCRACLEIMDGSFEKGLERIGTERYEEMVNKIIKARPKAGRAKQD